MPIIMMADLEKIQKWLIIIYDITYKAKTDSKISKEDFETVKNCIEEINKVIRALKF